jgi:hypothetical protein
MSGANSQLVQWLVASLFWISVPVSLCGFVFLIYPDLLLRHSQKLNRWISTAWFFNALDRPRHIERQVYHYHRIFGLIIVFGAAYSLYVFLFDTDIQRIIRVLPVLGNTGFSEWFYEIIYYLLICANIAALIAGLIIFIRPSLLKKIEVIANRWVADDELTRPLDQTVSIPEHILPGNIRLFGLIVLIGGLYIMFNTGIMLL